MGETESNRPSRLIGALSVAAATAALLSSCAGLHGAGSAGASDVPEIVATSTPAPAISTPAPDPTTPAPAPDETAPAAKAAVDPFVTAASWDGSGIDVGALVPKIVESGGTCTATATRDGVTVEQSGPAVAAASYTGCPQLVLHDERLVPGTWQVAVSYASDTSAGTSTKTAAVTVR